MRRAWKRVSDWSPAPSLVVPRPTTRLRAVRLIDLPILRGFDLARGIELAGKAADTVERGDAGYVLLSATKP